MFRKAAPRSLLARTLTAVALAIVVLMAATIGYLYDAVREEALSFKDRRLLDIATSLARADVAQLIPGALTMDTRTFEERLESDDPILVRRRHMMRPPTERLVRPRKITSIPAGEPVTVRLLNLQGELREAVFDHTLSEGVTTVELNESPDGSLTPYRLAVIFLPNGRYTAVAEPMMSREGEVRYMALKTVAPLLVLLPLMLAVIGFVIWKTLAPLRASAREIRRREPHDLTAIPLTGVPAEVEPLVSAINDLLARVEAARSREIRFTADAAHELRSPLTALTLEADRLSAMPLSVEAREAVTHLEEGLERAVHQVSQLLLFARAQSSEQKSALERDSAPWCLDELAASLFEELMPAFSAKNQTVGFEADEADAARPLTGLSGAAVRIVLRNLLENASRYTPAGGEVTLAAAPGKTSLTLTVSDTGPGIPAAERERVFDPFYRGLGTGVTGTGLGLSIVKTTVELMGGEVTLSEARPGATPPGLSVTVRLPLKAAATPKA